jgi:hypothetical protein
MSIRPDNESIKKAAGGDGDHQREPHARTPLGKRLREIRARIVASGDLLLDWQGIDRQLARRMHHPLTMSPS